MTMGDWIALGGFLTLLAGFLVKYGELKRMVTDLSDASKELKLKIETLATKVELAEVAMRQKEDREKNDKRFEELFISRNQHESILATVGTNMQNLTEAFSSMRDDVRESFAELKKDMREMRCQGD